MPGRRGNVERQNKARGHVCRDSGVTSLCKHHTCWHPSWCMTRAPGTPWERDQLRERLEGDQTTGGHRCTVREAC